jgi:hypothetical protein
MSLTAYLQLAHTFLCMFASISYAASILAIITLTNVVSILLCTVSALFLSIICFNLLSIMSRGLSGKAR